MRAEDVAAVRAMPLFHHCHGEALRALLRGAFLQRFPGGVVLFREGEPADFMYLLVEGRVELFASAFGRQATTALAEPGATLVLAAVLSDKLYLQSARTLENSRILMVPAEAVRDAVAHDAGFATAVIAETAARYRELVKDIKDLKLRSGAERLANWLLRNASPEDGRHLVRLPVEKRVLASRLGMTPENLSRAFQTLSRYGVATSGATIEIGDPESLARFAKPTPLIDDREV